MSIELEELLRKAKERWDGMTPEQQDEMLKAQRESWVRGEMAMGTDRDEAEYRAALRARDAMEAK